MTFQYDVIGKPKTANPTTNGKPVISIGTVSSNTSQYLSKDTRANVETVQSGLYTKYNTRFDDPTYYTA